MQFPGDLGLNLGLDLGLDSPGGMSLTCLKRRWLCLAPRAPSPAGGAQMGAPAAAEGVHE